jgi:hypothetical protein
MLNLPLIDEGTANGRSSRSWALDVSLLEIVSLMAGACVLAGFSQFE